MRQKSIIALMIALIFTFGILSMAMASVEVKGTITKIDGNKVTVRDDKGKETTVEVKDPKGLKVGDKVSIKDGVATKEVPKKKKPEGC